MLIRKTTVVEQEGKIIRRRSHIALVLCLLRIGEEVVNKGCRGSLPKSAGGQFPCNRLRSRYTWNDGVSIKVLEVPYRSLQGGSFLAIG